MVLQAVDAAHHWYYLLEMGFYVSLLLSVSVDVKRKVSVTSLLNTKTISLCFQCYCLDYWLLRQGFLTSLKVLQNVSTMRDKL